jgi:hypothetical protein
MNLFMVALLWGSLFVLSSCVAYKVLKFLLFKTEENVFTIGTSTEKKE